MKLLQNIEVSSHDFGFSNGFFEQKKKIDTLDSIKVENFCTSKCVVKNSYIM